MNQLGFNDFLENKQMFIGKKCVHQDGEEDTIADIYNDNGMLWFKMENKNNSLSGISEIVSGYDYGEYINVSIRYCGSFTVYMKE